MLLVDVHKVIEHDILVYVENIRKSYSGRLIKDSDIYMKNQSTIYNVKLNNLNMLMVH